MRQAGQAGGSLHTMSVLQAYQADLLEEFDTGEGIGPEAVKELRRATGLPAQGERNRRPVLRLVAPLIGSQPQLAGARPDLRTVIAAKRADKS